MQLLFVIDPNDSDYTNELFTSKWRVGESGSEMHKYVKLKAELSSESTAQTPALTSYRIKLRPLMIKILLGGYR